MVCRKISHRPGWSPLVYFFFQGVELGGIPFEQLATEGGTEREGEGDLFDGL